MRNKLLTISIAAFNVEKFVRTALESCVDPLVRGDIEVIVVNDGSTDSTLPIVEEYASLYPDTVRVIDKDNGGYGTTITASLECASGLYYRLLDGDDWFDLQGLCDLIELLRGDPLDCIISPRFIVEDGVKRIESLPIELTNKPMSIGDLPGSLYLGMWHMTVRTSLLRDVDGSFPKYTLYTDQLFVVYSLSRIQTVGLSSSPLYCYRIGREEQSTSAKSRLKHVDDLERVVNIAIDYLLKTEMEQSNQACVEKRIVGYYATLLKTFFLDKPSRKALNSLRRVDLDIYHKAPNLYSELGSSRRWVRLLRSTHYYAYWPIAIKGVSNWV